jgi:hypothetical protein
VLLLLLLGAFEAVRSAGCAGALPEGEMTDKARQRHPVPDRARKRAIRAQAARADVPYSVAARQLDAAWLAPGELLASHGRTVYPAVDDTHRQSLIECRARLTKAQRVQDTRRAANLPTGRAGHLADRFPPTRGAQGTGVGLLYHGEGRQQALAVLYAVIAHEAPDVVPSAGDLAWQAELGEETAVDTACAVLDRMARLLLTDHAGLVRRLDAVLAAGEASDGVMDRALDDPLTRKLSQPAWRASLDGARHILDATLIVADDGHAPGTRVRMLSAPFAGRTATIIGALWDRTGPPTGYEVWPDGAAAVATAHPNDLVVLASPERAMRRSPHV